MLCKKLALLMMLDTVSSDNKMQLHHLLMLACLLVPRSTYLQDQKSDSALGAEKV